MRIKDIDGLPVIDAKEGIVLFVSPKDVREADPKNPGECAIAKTCKRQLHVREARVHLSRLYLRSNDHNWVRYELPRAARDEIISFDRGGRFVPIEIFARPVQVNHPLGKRASSSNKRGGGKKRASPRVLTGVRHGPA